MTTHLRRAAALLALALAVSCTTSDQPINPPGPPDAGVPGTPDAGEPPDAGPIDRNLGGDVPVRIEWIRPFDLRHTESLEASYFVDDWAADSAGRVVLVGRAYGNVDFDPTEGTDIRSLGQVSRIFLTLLKADGSYGWTRVWLTTRNSDDSMHVEVAPSGAIYVASTFRSNRVTVFDADPEATTYLLDSGDVLQLFVARLDMDGHLTGAWNTLGDGIVDELAALSVGPTGLWMTGFFQGLIDFDTGPRTTMLRSGTGLPYPRAPFLAHWKLDGSLGFAYVPPGRSMGNVSPTGDGSALFVGTYGGVGTDIRSAMDVDLDPGPGVDIRNPGCPRRGDSNQCVAQAYFGRLEADGSVSWTADFQRISRDRSNVLPTPASGGPIALPDGSGVLLGTATAEVDFDWTSAEDVYTFPWHAQDSYFDVFAAGISREGGYRGVTRSRTMRVSNGELESTWVGGSWSEPDRTLYSTGWTQGFVLFPSAGAGGVGRPAESFLAAFDEKGGLRWATGLGYGIPLGGTGAAQVRTSASGSTFLLGRFSGRADLDFTSGLAPFNATSGGWYLVSFRPEPCSDGATRACTCEWENRRATATSCSGGRWEPCACRQELLNTDGSVPARPAPDCGLCAAGWSCNPVTWLCEDPGETRLASGLDHPTEVLDDGTHVYFIVAGRYPRTSPAAETPSGTVWRVPRGGGTPERIRDGIRPHHLTLHDGWVYWSDLALYRTAVGGDGSVETVLASGSDGAFAIDANAWYLTRGIYVVKRDRTTGIESTALVPQVDELRALVVDGWNVYVLAARRTEGTGSGLYRMPVTGFGGTFSPMVYANDPRALVDAGNVLYFSAFATRPSIGRYDKVTGVVSAAVDSMEGELGSMAWDGSALYFTRYGRRTARDWIGEVWRLAPAASPSLVASSIQHAADVDVRSGRIVVAETGETRATTTTGNVRAFEVR
ncbi:MAG TPA: hypothetical protein VNA24_27405 [Hyalangium sp.]|nr:hypothetical protein [Hyalangium sp.]